MTYPDAQQILYSPEHYRDIGMAQAEDHANYVHEDWSVNAFNFLLRNLPEDPFMGEEIIKAARGIIPEPPDPRAWGPIIRKAALSGFIKRVGYGKARKPSGHAHPVAIWQKT